MLALRDGTHLRDMQDRKTSKYSEQPSDQFDFRMGAAEPREERHDKQNSYDRTRKEMGARTVLRSPKL